MEVVGLVALLVVMAWNAGYWMGRSGRAEAKTIYVERYHERPVRHGYDCHCCGNNYVVDHRGMQYRIDHVKVARAIGPIHGAELIHYEDGSMQALPNGMLWICACCGSTMGSQNQWCLECGHARGKAT